MTMNLKQNRGNAWWLIIAFSERINRISLPHIPRIAGEFQGNSWVYQVEVIDLQQVEISENCKHFWNDSTLATCPFSRSSPQLRTTTAVETLLFITASVHCELWHKYSNVLNSAGVPFGHFPQHFVYIFHILIFSLTEYWCLMWVTWYLHWKFLEMDVSWGRCSVRGVIADLMG